MSPPPKPRLEPPSATKRTLGGVGAGVSNDPGYPITPGMGVNLWGESPLCQDERLKECSIPNAPSDRQSTSRRQLRGGDEPWEGSPRANLRGYVQKPHTRPARPDECALQHEIVFVQPCR